MSGLKLTMIRRGETLVPSAPMFLEDIQSIPEGKEIVVTATRSRSPQHLRRFFAKLRVIRKSGAWDSDEESLLGYLKLGVGYVTAVVDQTSMMVSAAMLGIAEAMVAKYPASSDEGRLARFVISLAGPRTYLVPKSISFENLDQSGFNDFEQRTDKFIAEKFGIDPEELMRQTAEISEGPTQRDCHDGNTLEPEHTAPEPLQTRLERLADELHHNTPEAVEEAWRAAWAREDTKELVSLAPKIVEQLVGLSRKTATGFFSEAGYLEMRGKIIGKAIDAALQEAEAA